MCFSFRTRAWLGIYTGACPLPQAHILMVEMFSLKQLLKTIIHMISRLSLHLSDVSVCLFIYLLGVVCGGIHQSTCCYTAPKSQWLTTVTHI